MLSRALPATEGGFTVVHTRENQPEAATVYEVNFSTLRHVFWVAIDR